MSLTGFHPLWDNILSQNLQADADQGCHLEGSSPSKGTVYRGVYCIIKVSQHIAQPNCAVGRRIGGDQVRKSDWDVT
jgi:hypothetical protein